MPTIGTAAFFGQRSRLAAHLLDDTNASACLDAYMVDGTLRPLPGLLADATLATAPLTIYKWEETAYWLTWDERVHVVRSVNPAVERIYFTGTDAPRVGQVGTGPGGIFEGAGPYPTSSFLLGVPAPGNAPSCAVTDLEPDPERDYAALDLETRYYAYTYVNEWGEESARSPISAPVECYDDSEVEVSVSLASSAGYVAYASVRIYRTNTGTDATAFQFVTEATWAAAATPIPDVTPSALLAEVAETFEWDTPPVDLRSLTLVAGDFYAGVSGREVCLSESRVPYAWPLAYRFPMEEHVVALASNGAELVALTQGRPVVFTGNNPQAVQIVRLAEYQPCMSERSVTVFGGMVIYASPDGLIGISSSQGFRNLTAEVFTREQWAAMDPGSMRIAVYEEQLLVSSAEGSWLLDLAARSFTPTTVTHDVAYYDGFGDRLYLMQGADRFIMGEGADLPYEWTSKLYSLPDWSFVCGRVHALTYNDLHVELWLDGRRAHRKRVDDGRPFRLPPTRGRALQLRLVGVDTVRSASFATSFGELLP